MFILQLLAVLIYGCYDEYKSNKIDPIKDRQNKLYEYINARKDTMTYDEFAELVIKNKDIVKSWERALESVETFKVPWMGTPFSEFFYRWGSTMIWY